YTTVNTTHNKQKIIVRGYLLVKDKNRNNSFYWCCEYKDSHNCKGKAVTILEGQSHVLKKFNEHNYTPEPSYADVIQALNNMREIASQSCERPSQIIHDITINMPEDSFYNMPNNKALCKQISRIRLKNIPTQPQALQEIDISNHLQKANYWLMDGTFKTVPTLFRQLYAMHTPVGGETNFHVFPLVYILMTNQLEESYKQVFQELLNLSEEAGYNLNLPIIITDFEQSVINTIQIKFSNSVHKSCFFHICQNFWRKIQVEGLAIEYGNNESFSLRLRYLVALAFLSYSEIPAAFDTIKPLMPSNVMKLLIISKIIKFMEEFDNSFEMELQLKFHLYFHHHFGKAHLGTYTIIEEMHKEQQQVDMQIEHVLRGEPHPTQRKRLVDHEKRIISVFNNRDTYTVVDFLR
ncbi:2834_t:CDS:2, partial [Dentiscutata heterogama]